MTHAGPFQDPGKSLRATVVVGVVAPERTRGESIRLARLGMGIRDFSLAATRALRRAVPFDGLCVLTFDPAAILPTGEVLQGDLPQEARARPVGHGSTLGDGGRSAKIDISADISDESVRSFRPALMGQTTLLESDSSDTYRRYCGLPGPPPSRAAERSGSTTPRQPPVAGRLRVPTPAAMEVVVRPSGKVALRTTWHAWRHHVDLCRTCAALCPA